MPSPITKVAGNTDFAVVNEGTETKLKYRPASISHREQYAAARSAAAAAAVKAEFLALRGPDALDFLHRMSTNDLLALKIDQATPTVLVTEKGRIIDLVTVLRRKNDLLMLTSPGNASLIKSWLEKYIIMEEIQIDDVSREFSSHLIIGPHAITLVNEQLNLVVSEDPNAISRATVDGVEWSFLRSTYGRMQAVQTISSGMKASLPLSLPTLAPEVLNAIRIEEGIPAYPSELNERVNPLESGLRSCISFTKGCYIGQEVIARLDTYKKIQRSLCGFAFDPALSTIPAPGKVVSHGREVGWTTSHSWSFRLERPIALGYLENDVQEQSFELLPSDGSGGIEIHLSALPF